MPRNMSSLFAALRPPLWAAVPLAAGGLLVLALAPPYLPAWARPLVMDALAPACHQLPARSPHWHGIALALCDRCIGIYTGALAGGLLCRFAARYAPVSLGPWALLGVAAAPALVDWLGPWLGLWANTPLSRGLTGCWLGGAVAWLLVRALRHASRP